MPPYHWENPPSDTWEPGEKRDVMVRKAELPADQVYCMFHDCDGVCLDHDLATYITRCRDCGQLWRKEDQMLLRVIKRLERHGSHAL